MKIALAQINTVVGDVEYNVSIAKEYILSAYKNGSEVIALPELVTTGYPPKDLLFREDLISANIKGKNELVNLTKDIPVTIIFGYAEPTDKDGMKSLYNAACVAKDGKILQTRYKTLLPTYDVFEEYRYFEPGPKTYKPFDLNGEKVGVIICEEAWNDKTFWNNHLYEIDPVSEMVKSGAKSLIVINSSPFRNKIYDTRRKMISQQAKKYGIPISYVNQVGYNDEVGFDGCSFAVNKTGNVIAFGIPFVQENVYVDTNANPINSQAYEFDWQQVVLSALTIGIKDYLGKLKFDNTPAVIGLSGGIDSAIVAYLAVRALGKDRVIGVGMPSEFSSEGSVNDAEKIAKKLGIKFIVQPIKNQHNSIRDAVDGMNKGLNIGNYKDCKDSGVTDENLQARIRGIYLMALANYYNGIVLSTGNKSELAVGYCTIYGDMVGGLAVISDVPKTMVYELCEYINKSHNDEIIPWNTIKKAPSAELRANQFDQQTLPPYVTLDEILYKLVDEAKSPAQIIAEMVSFNGEMKYLAETNRNLKDDIIWVCKTISNVEFKRKQAAPGLKISQKCFKYGWNKPIVHRLPTIQ